MLISIEHELPTSARNGDTGVSPAVFQDVWGELSREGWNRNGDFAVSRLPIHFHPGAKKPEQVITTDAGPSIELVPSPEETVQGIERQTTELRALAGAKFRVRGVDLLGSGVHLRLGSDMQEYLQYRTPRKAYDYAIEKRGWNHNTMLNITSLQEIIDVPVAKAPSAVGLLHQLAGAMLFLFRNDAEYREQDKHRLLTIRPRAWRDQVPNAGPFKDDIQKVCLPSREVNSWREYLHLLWESSSMFILGTKSGELTYVPAHPTFATFMTSAPKKGWMARTIGGKLITRINPSMEHVKQTDWTYMGFARLRLFWEEGVKLNELVTAYREGGEYLEGFLAEGLSKVLVENRSNACPRPGEEMSSLAFVTGIIENLGNAIRFANTFPYSFWLKVARTAETLPIYSRLEGVQVLDLLAKLLKISQEGLVRRGYGEGQYLEPLFRRVRDGRSPSEEMLAIFDKGGIEAVSESLLYR